MDQQISFIALTGCLCLMLSIVAAICLTGINYLKLQFMGKVFPGHQNLLKAHLDFAIMAALLFAIYLLFLNLKINPSGIITALLCTGAITNPSGFVSLAVKPSLSRDPLSPFGVFMTLCFSSTALGFSGSAFLIAKKLLV